MSKKRKSSESSLPPSVVIIPIYGIWSKVDKKIVYINLDQEETETEYDLEGYPDNTHAVVCLNAAYDISSLEQ